MSREEAIAEYRKARDAYYAAGAKADAAFARWFTKRQNGERTSGAAAARLANQTNWLSAEMVSAQGKLYALGVDPWDIDDADGVERSEV